MPRTTHIFLNLPHFPPPNSAGDGKAGVLGPSGSVYGFAGFGCMVMYFYLRGVV